MGHPNGCTCNACFCPNVRYHWCATCGREWTSDPPWYCPRCEAQGRGHVRLRKGRRPMIEKLMNPPRRVANSWRTGSGQELEAMVLGQIE